MPSMGAAAAELAVVVTADTREAEAGLASLGSKVSGAGNALAGLAAGAAVAGIGALAAGFAGAVTAAAGFEQAMSGIQAVSGATGSQMQQLSSLALQLGKDTSFSASEAAAGIEELVKGGVSIPDIMNGAAQATLALAAAGGTSLPEAATIAANALAQFNLKGEDMAHVADLIAGAANASALDVNDFSFSLKAAGAVASTIGFSFDDLAQAIAVMGKAGITGSDAGTSLKTMMMRLIPSTDKASNLMKELGIITADGANQFFDATGKVKSMADVAQVLQDALKGMSQEQKIATLNTLFGSDAIRAAAVLAKEGAAGFNEMAAAMGQVTAASVAATRLDNLKGSFEQLKGSLETFAIVVGSAFLPMLRAGVDGLTGFVNSLIPLAETWGPRIAQTILDIGETIRQVFAGDWSPDAAIAPLTNAIGVAAVFVRDVLMPPLVALVTFLADHTEIIAGFAASLLTLVGVSAAVASITAVAGAIAFLLSPIGLVAAAVGLLVAAWVGNWGGIQEKTQAVIDFVVPYIQQGLAAIQAFWAEWGPTILAAASAAWDGIVTVVTAAVGAISTAIQTGIAVWNTIVATWETISTAVTTTMETISTAISTAWETITTTVSGAIQTVSDTLTAGWQAILDFITTTMATIQATIQAVWLAIPEDIRADLELLTNHYIAAGAAWIETITTTLTALATLFTTWVATVIAAVTQWVADMAAQYTALQTQATTIITTMTAALLTLIQTWIAATVAAITQWAVDFLAPITNLLGPATAAALAIGTGILTSIQTKLAEVIAAVIEFGGNLVSQLRGLVGQATSAAAAIGQGIIDGIRGAVMAGASAIANAAAQVVRDALQKAKAAAGLGGGEGRAAGGPVRAGVPYVVGEVGPELFVPAGAGRIVNHRDFQAMGGGFDVRELAAAVASQIRPSINVYGAGTEDVIRKVDIRMRREQMLTVGAFSG